MATRSILKNVNIKNARAVKNFIRSMENAQYKKSRKVAITKAYSEATEDEMRALLRETNDRV